MSEGSGRKPRPSQSNPYRPAILPISIPSLQNSVQSPLMLPSLHLHSESEGTGYRRLSRAAARMSGAAAVAREPKGSRCRSLPTQKAAAMAPDSFSQG